MRPLQKILIALLNRVGFESISKFRLLRILYWKLYLFYKQFYEAREIIQITQMLKTTTSRDIQCILDIGAHIGSSSHFFKQALPHAVIHAFEPDPRNHFFFREVHSADIESDSIYLVKSAVWKTSGLIPFRMEANNSADNKFDVSAVALVPAITIDEYVESQSLEVNLVKVDVQGYELEVLLGAQRTLKDQMPLLVIEIDKVALSNRSKTYNSILEMLKSLGYQAIDTRRRSRLSEKELYEMTNEQPCRDVLFVPSSQNFKYEDCANLQ